MAEEDERGRGTEQKRKSEEKKREDGCQFLRTFWMSYAAHMFCHLFTQQILTEPGSLLRYWVHSSEKDKYSCLHRAYFLVGQALLAPPKSEPR